MSVGVGATAPQFNGLDAGEGDPVNKGGFALPSASVAAAGVGAT